MHCNHPYEQLSQDELKKIESRMYPGHFSELGFLQPGETLHEVYLADKQFLETVGITYDQIFDRLTTIIGKYYTCCNQTGNRTCLIENKYSISSETYMGAQTCPFKNEKLDNDYHGYEYGDTDITITTYD